MVDGGRGREGFGDVGIQHNDVGALLVIGAGKGIAKDRRCILEREPVLREIGRAFLGSHSNFTHRSYARCGPVGRTPPTALSYGWFRKQDSLQVPAQCGTNTTSTATHAHSKRNITAVVLKSRGAR